MITQKEMSVLNKKLGSPHFKVVGWSVMASSILSLNSKKVIKLSQTEIGFPPMLLWGHRKWEYGERAT